MLLPIHTKKELKKTRSINVQNEIKVIRYNMPSIFEDGFFDDEVIDDIGL